MRDTTGLADATGADRQANTSGDPVAGFTAHVVRMFPLQAYNEHNVLVHLSTNCP